MPSDVKRRGRERKKKRKNRERKKMVGPTEGGGFEGPPRMEGGRGNLEGHAKWRGIWRACWS
jgi:hypothetical protein